MELDIKMDKQDRYYMFNTLLSLAKGVEKRYTTIDLRNETCVTGQIQHVDGFMNVVMAQAALYDTDGKCSYCPIMHIQARNIRNIHIPDNVNITKVIKEQVAVSVGEKKKPGSKQKTFKQKRALLQQAESLKLVKEMKEKMEKDKADKNVPSQD